MFHLKKDKLFRKYFISKDPKSKKDYFKNYFEKNKNNKYFIWRGIQQLTSLKYKSSRQPNIITIKPREITNPKNIANDSNNFFTNIFPSFSKRIP